MSAQPNYGDFEACKELLREGAEICKRGYKDLAAAGRIFIEAQERCQRAGNIWKDSVSKYCPVSYVQVRNCILIAKADDPEKAAAEHRAKNAIANQDHRAKKSTSRDVPNVTESNLRKAVKGPSTDAPAKPSAEVVQLPQRPSTSFPVYQGDKVEMVTVQPEAPAPPWDEPDEPAPNCEFIPEETTTPRTDQIIALLHECDNTEREHVALWIKLNWKGIPCVPA